MVCGWFIEGCGVCFWEWTLEMEVLEREWVIWGFKSLTEGEEVMLLLFDIVIEVELVIEYINVRCLFTGRIAYGYGMRDFSLLFRWVVIEVILDEEVIVEVSERGIDGVIFIGMLVIWVFFL